MTSSRKLAEKLSPKEHWEDTWGGIRLPKTINTNRYVYWRFDELYGGKFEGKGYKTLLEVGCAPASWLIYFNRRFGFDVSGIEYSKTGYEISRKNLGMAGVGGDIIYGDFFEHKFDRKFDVVYSGGFVEHFEDIMQPLKKCYDLLNDGGMLVASVPNLRDNIYSKITGLVNPEVTKMYKIPTLEELRECYEKLGLKEIDVRNFGTWNLCIVHFGRHRILSGIATAADEGVKTALKALRIRGESASLSPYMVAFGIK